MGEYDQTGGVGAGGFGGVEEGGEGVVGGSTLNGLVG